MHNNPNAFHLTHGCRLSERGGGPRRDQHPRWLQAPCDGSAGVPSLGVLVDRGSVTVARTVVLGGARERAASRVSQEWARQRVADADK